VGPLVVHVHDAVLGNVVLDAGSRLLRSPPVRASAGERLVSARLAEDATVGLRADAVLMGVRRPADLDGRVPVCGQLGQPWTEARIDVAVQDFGSRIDVRISVPRAQAVLHPVLLPSSWTVTRGSSARSEEHTSELQSHLNLVCRLLLEKK